MWGADCRAGQEQETREEVVVMSRRQGMEAGPGWGSGGGWPWLVLKIFSGVLFPLPTLLSVLQMLKVMW